ncbi:P-loop NTPase fold protein [Methylocaldum sp.]|uniref:P-loop NTPase fold protein n=1 Tax=Methylocaldum sp. TaxID=1969727 RepID=UPI002D50A9F9|nr:P-loop NTPase fold protein [Methylocaldum sp.]HYE34769.1 P-loop NTPase fold protein [Methylocaldum sp.]
MTRLLDDQPIGRTGDKLRFDRALAVIERLVLTRRAPEGSPEAPFVVGLFGRWGSGKSSLLKILAERLEEENEQAKEQHPSARWSLLRRVLPNALRKRLGFLADPLAFSPPWIVVEFSPWHYRHLPSLLVPLLAALAKKQPRLWIAIRKMAGMNTGWMAKLIGWMTSKGGCTPETFVAAQTALPVLALLQSLNEKAKKDRDAKDLAEQIADAVKEITKGKTRLVFLIDDLDRCHEPKQIVGLLEQIKLFLHLDNCLFFIAADRGQIVKAIETQFPGEGERYLEKFVQLAIELPQPDSRHLLDLLPDASLEDKACLERASEILGHNPRKLKALWNRAHACLALMREDLQGVTGFSHAPTLPLMVRWLLLQEAGLFRNNPYALLELESVLNGRHGSEAERRQAFNEKLQAHAPPAARRKNAKGDHTMAQTDPATNRLRERLAIHLWHARDTHFGKPGVLSLYLKAAGAAHTTTRQWLEEQVYAGATQFAALDLGWADLRDARLGAAIFEDCDFSGADLSGSDLSHASFARCGFAGAKLDRCVSENTRWTDCTGLHALDTDPETYEKLADLFVRLWESSPNEPPVAMNEPDGLHALYKTYTQAVQSLKQSGTVDEAAEIRLLNKGGEIRKKVIQATHGSTAPAVLQVSLEEASADSETTLRKIQAKD